MPAKDRLKTYRAKRAFSETSEPAGRKRGARPERQPIFVVQKHDATRLHYDFRLEADGVLKSWAVPKGPSTNPRDQRLAVQTEDHPIEYAEFEGVIPPGLYGAGPVIVWDRGTYRNVKDIPMSTALEEGHATFWLDGEKLRGAYSLTRMNRGKPGKEPWLLVKMNDEEADPDRDVTEAEEKSVVSGRTIKQVARKAD